MTGDIRPRRWATGASFVRWLSGSRRICAHSWTFSPSSPAAAPPKRSAWHWIAKSKSDPSVLKQAEAVKAEIKREAQTRRNAIAAIFDGDGATRDEAFRNPVNWCEQALPVTGPGRGQATQFSVPRPRPYSRRRSRTLQPTAGWRATPTKGVITIPSST